MEYDKLIVTVWFLSCLTVKFVYDVYPKNVKAILWKGRGIYYMLRLAF